MNPEIRSEPNLTGLNENDSQGLPPIISLKDFHKKDICKPPELIKGILHQGSKMVLGGGSKTFKTWILLDQALSVAFGVPWLGFETVAGRVLYINLEIPDFFFQDRIDQLIQAKKLSPESDMLHIWNLRGHAAEFSILLEGILSAIDGMSYSLIILDPIYKVLGDRNENAAGDVASLLNGIEMLAVKSNAAVSFGAHFSKGNQAAKESIDRISGSGVFARDPDSIITLTNHKTEESFTIDMILRNSPPVEPFVVTRKHPLMVRDESKNPKDLKSPRGRAQEYNLSDMLKLLKPDPRSTIEWKIACKEELGMSDRSFYYYRKKAEECGDIHKKNEKWGEAPSLI